jgi:hypothetical protein
MVKKGITPPDVRTDINDSPIETTDQPIEEGKRRPPSKPWQKSPVQNSSNGNIAPNADGN